MNTKAPVLVTFTAALLMSGAAARADVEINTKPTSNMSCDAGVCTATAQKAVLNVSDLANMLASGDVAVKTGLVAKDIEISQPLTWSSTSRLTLDAQQSVTIRKQVTVAGQGALTVTTNDTGQPHAKSKTGEFIIVPERGSVQFWDLGSSLIIDGNAYTLVGDIKTLASDVAANPSGFYALAKPYDASVDGAYTFSPISTTFTGNFEGLGNSISNIAFQFSPGGVPIYTGLFADLGRSVVRDIHILNGSVRGQTCEAGAGVALLAAVNDEGLIEYSSATGTIAISGGCSEGVGGLVAGNGYYGRILRSFASVRITMTNALGGAGGLVDSNGGVVSESFSKGSIIAKGNSLTPVGGLIGTNQREISNSFAQNAVHEGKDCCGSQNSFGGLIGENSSGGAASSYASGKMHWGHSADPNASRGGLIGTDEAPKNSMSNTYWDLDKGISDPAQGAGNVENDPGITGLTTAQFQSGLPAGFDPSIWGQDPKTNGGFPYLKALQHH